MSFAIRKFPENSSVESQEQFSGLGWLGEVCDSLLSAPQASPTRSVSGRVHAITRLSDDMMKVVISIDANLETLPGQHIFVGFAGYPARAYSPTVPLNGKVDAKRLCFHVRRVPNGLVSSALGARIGPDHAVTISGPQGSSYLRLGFKNRLVLVSSGAGFAPIWAIAQAALREAGGREIVVLAQAKDRDGFYMARTLVRLAARQNVRVIPVVRPAQKTKSAIWRNHPLVFMPKLSSDDIVHPFGAPLLVEGVAAIARAAGALCFAEPFIAAEPA